MMREGGWVTRVWLSRGICDDVSVLAEQFCQIVFDCVHATPCHGTFTETMFVGPVLLTCWCQRLAGWKAYEAA